MCGDVQAIGMQNTIWSGIQFHVPGWLVTELRLPGPATKRWPMRKWFWRCDELQLLCEVPDVPESGAH